MADASFSSPAGSPERIKWLTMAVRTSPRSVSDEGLEELANSAEDLLKAVVSIAEMSLAEFGLHPDHKIAVNIARRAIHWTPE